MWSQPTFVRGPKRKAYLIPDHAAHLLSYLALFRARAVNGRDAARASAARHPNGMYLQQLAYWENCVSCIDWLIVAASDGAKAAEADHAVNAAADLLAAYEQKSPLLRALRESDGELTDAKG